eukprot:1047864-Pelagomonas_calceolata.AAC.5
MVGKRACQPGTSCREVRAETRENAVEAQPDVNTVCEAIVERREGEPQHLSTTPSINRPHTHPDGHRWRRGLGQRCCRRLGHDLVRNAAHLAPARPTPLLLLVLRMGGSSCCLPAFALAPLAGSAWPGGGAVHAGLVGGAAGAVVEVRHRGRGFAVCAQLAWGGDLRVQA